MDLRSQITALLEQAPHGRLPLAALGSLLRLSNPDFRPRRFGHRNLLELVRALEVGELVVDPTGLHWTLVAEPNPEEPTEAESIVSTSEPASTQSTRIERSWWSLVTAPESSAGAWYDLANEAPTCDAAAVHREPERYIELPRWPESRQLSLVEAAQRSRLADLSLSAAKRLRARLRIEVEAELSSWSRSFGVPESQWRVSLREFAESIRPASGEGSSEGRRERWIAWIRGLSEQELDTLESALELVGRAVAQSGSKLT
ncbi:MAG: hypothetical protein RIT45_2993 [Pseudomonadota bacterium]|jgi:hypothetical protein